MTTTTLNTRRPVPLASGFSAEIYKGMLNLRGEWRSIIVQMLMFPVFYLLVVLFMGRGQMRTDLLITGVLGMVPLTFIYEQVNRSFWSYLGDIQSGVLEQTYLTSLPSWALILGRQVSSAISALPQAVAVYVAGLIAIAAEGGSLPFNVQILVPLAAIVLGTSGLALILSGLTLVYKRVEIATQISTALWFIAGGTFVPLTNMPDWAAYISRAIIPIAPGIEAMREILFKGRSLAGLHDGWGLGWLLLQPILLILVGGVLFAALERVAKRRGTLGRY
jgi:ABC-type polysaccharide/polyol phosphate export permease